MKCPYCNEEMIIGNIYGDRYILKWLPEDEKLFLGIWAKDSIKLGQRRGLGRPTVKAYMCQPCDKLIVDMNVEKHI